MWIHSRTATVFLCVQNDTVCETTGSSRHKKWAPIKRIHQKSSVIHTNTIYIHVCLDSERAPCNLDRETSYEKNELFRISLKLFATIQLNYNCALYSRRICLLSPFRLFLSLSVCLLFSKIRRMDNNNISFPFYQARPTHPNTSPVRLISVHDDVLRHWKRLRNDWDIGSDYGTERIHRLSLSFHSHGNRSRTESVHQRVSSKFGPGNCNETIQTKCIHDNNEMHMHSIRWKSSFVSVCHETFRKDRESRSYVKVFTRKSRDCLISSFSSRDCLVVVNIRYLDCNLQKPMSIICFGDKLT